MNKDVMSIIVITIFVLALALPSSNKAYHIDDTAFIYMADQIIKDPLRPYSFVLEWGAHSGLATHLLDTPLVSYYIALIAWLFGGSEIILHTSFIIFPIIAGASFYFLAKKFIKWPLAATLIMLATPTLLVSSQSLMLDVPMLSFFLLSTTLFIYGIDKENHKLLFFGSLVAGLAYLAKPNAIFIIPLLLLYMFLRGKQKYLYYLLIPILFITLFALHNYFFEDKILIKEYIPWLYGKKGKSIGTLIAYIFSNLSYIGGATIFPLFFIYPFILKKKNLILLSVSFLISIVSSLLLYRLSSAFISGQYTFFQISLFFIFITSSIFFILLILVENYSHTKSALLSILNFKNTKYDANTFFIFVWFMGFYFLNSGISGGAVRYNTLLLPPLILSYFILFEKYLNQFKVKKSKLIMFAIFFTAVIGVAVAYADYDFASSYREFAKNVPIQYKTSDNTIWFTGSWGFQYYMQKNGYRILLHNDNSPKKRDVIIKAVMPTPRKFSPKLMPRTELIKIITYAGKIPIRTQNPKAHAGFYTYGGGFLPYSLSTSKLETFEIYSVKE